MKIRMARLDDVSALLSIYSQYIDTPVTFEYTLPTEEEFETRVINILRCYPYLVACEGDTVVGYAYAHRAWQREAYRWGAELSIYLAHSATGKGIGTQLYTRLIELLRGQGIRTVYSCVTVPNLASEKLHKKLLFRQVGVFRNAGFKNGAWHDVAWFEKPIGEYSVPETSV